MIKRNDIWAICLGIVQLILFSKLLMMLPANILKPSFQPSAMPPNAFGAVQQQAGLQPLVIFRFIMMIVSLFFLFSNISRLSKILSAKDDAVNDIVRHIINTSAGILIVILVVTLFQGY